ncbi:MAG: methyltransferase domain-containing protein [Alphaproteobacteria bacterium]|nr:methyltransferase domain-containing protein [Alphaproteobacteria bacterium]
MPDVRDLAAFYDAPLGQLAKRVILRHVENFWPDLRGLRVLGYGFPIPYARLFTGAERVIAAIPAPFGAITWPQNKNATLVCEEDALPFPDVFFDRILIVHGLESAESLRPLLRQLWRVLAPEGKILLVAPNRASLWAQVQVSPFGHGRPFSHMELEALLKDALLEPGRWTRALYAPPFRSMTGSGTGWEKLGRTMVPGIGGVHVVEASKSLYAAATPLPKAAKVALQQAKAAEDF